MNIDMDRIILHCDANNFFASVELKNNPDLKDKPVAVAGDPELRHGIILAKNELAKKYNIKTGDTILEAKKKCNDIIFVPPHYNEYIDISKKIFKIYSSYTDLVESFGIDECWLDITNSIKLFGSVNNIAHSIKNRIKDELGITISIGISFSKIFAKLGSDLAKSDDIMHINRDNYKDIIWPLPVSSLLMVGKKTNNALKKLNIQTIGDLALANERFLTYYLKSNGTILKNAANGIDKTPSVKPYNQVDLPKSIGHSTTLKRDISQFNEIRAVMLALSEMVFLRMRHHSLTGNGVALLIKYSDFSTITRNMSFENSILNSVDIYENAIKIFEKNNLIAIRTPIREIGISIFNLKHSETEYQSNYFYDLNQKLKRNELENSIEKIRTKYGYRSIQNGIISCQNDLCENLIPQEFIAFKKIVIEDI